MSLNKPEEAFDEATLAPDYHVPGGISFPSILLLSKNLDNVSISSATKQKHFNFSSDVDSCDGSITLKDVDPGMKSSVIFRITKTSGFES